MKNIRKSCFETNSSSSHSLVITKEFYGSRGEHNKKYGLIMKKSDKPVYDYESLRSCIHNIQTESDPKRVIEICGSTFGRDELYPNISSYVKLNYLVTYIKGHIERMSERKYFENILKNIIKRAFPEVDDVLFNNAEEDNDKNPCYEDYYDYEPCEIDGESLQLAHTILTSDGIELKDFGVFSLYDFIFNTSYILITGEDARFFDSKNHDQTEKIDENTFFLTAFSLKDDCQLKSNPDFFKERNYNYQSEFPDNIKLFISNADPEETIGELKVEHKSFWKKLFNL